MAVDYARCYSIQSGGARLRDISLTVWWPRRETPTQNLETFPLAQRKTAHSQPHTPMGAHSARIINHKLFRRIVQIQMIRRKERRLRRNFAGRFTLSFSFWVRLGRWRWRPGGQSLGPAEFVVVFRGIKVVGPEPFSKVWLQYGCDGDRGVE